MATLHQNPDYLTIQEVADRWRVGYDTIRREMRAGTLTYIKIGGVYRIPKTAVDSRENVPLPKGVGVKRALASVSSSKDHYPDC